LPSYNSISRALGDKRNWAAFLLAGAVVFLGAQVLEAWDFNSAASVIALIALATLMVRPLLKV
jgi:hypothetical protein